jgi:hypothetical protein
MDGKTPRDKSVESFPEGKTIYWPQIKADQIGSGKTLIG